MGVLESGEIAVRWDEVPCQMAEALGIVILELLFEFDRIGKMEVLA